ncbi:MAG: 50S ribosomal protein L25 [Nitrospinota bacterium]
MGAPSDLKVFSGRANPKLTQGIADYLGVEVGRADIYDFSDGEICVQIQENVRGADVFVVQSVCHPCNDNLMELLIMLDAFRRASARRITAVIPYYGYARQDRKVQPRVPITAKLVANLLVAAGTDRVLAMDLHAGQIQGFFDIPVDHLFATPVFIEYLRGREMHNLVVISPDAGGVERARAFAKRLGASLGILDKRREGVNVTEVVHIIGEVEGRDVLIVDDLVDTAATLTKGTAALREGGVRRIFACCTHAVLSGRARERLAQSCIEELVVTDTIPVEPQAAEATRIRVLSVAALLGEAIRRIHAEASVSSLFVEGGSGLPRGRGMEELVLKGERRERLGKGPSRALRREGGVPAVVYGQREPLPIAVDPRVLERLLATEGGEHALLQLDLPGERPGERKAIVKELQRDPVKPRFLHVDFLEVRMDRAVRVDVPILLRGEAPGVKAGGVLSQQLRALAIECLPGLIPRAIEVDIGGLELGDTVHVRDISMPEGVEAVVDPDEPVASVTAVAEEVEEVAAPAEAPAAAEEPLEGEKEGEGAS